MMDVFKDLLSNELMVDVTLACDGLSLKAHKIILSACSPFFKSLFLENPCKHPIVILKDMKYNELKNIIEFIYNGEVNVPEDQLNCFLKSADTLKIKGLAEYSNKNFTYTSIEEPSDITVHHNEVLTTTKCNTDCANKQTFNNFNHTDNVQEIKTVPVTVGIEPISADITKQLADVQPGISREPQTEGLLSNKKEFELSSTNSSENALTVNDLSNARKIIRRSLSLDAEIQMKHQNDNSHKSIPSEDLSPNHQPQSPLEIKSDELELDSPMSPVAGPSHNMADSMMIDQSSIPSHPDISFQQCVDLVSQDSMQGTASIIRTIYYSKNPLVDDEVTTINEELPKLKKKWKYKHIRQNHPKSIKSAACMASKLDEDPDYIPESGN
ncbi:protein bric-a-brac 2 [Nephila pilipes]|uniref:Protein bric-a-brac 2 n=1 Tax=Nephila pilipes TaxID=299642 RepID=A0A8X6MY69_NEPPI|nr:protein bric-a-brac 2 [Nephila pilipes]